MTRKAGKKTKKETKVASPVQKQTSKKTEKKESPKIDIEALKKQDKEFDRDLLTKEKEQNAVASNEETKEDVQPEQPKEEVVEEKKEEVQTEQPQEEVGEEKKEEVQTEQPQEEGVEEKKAPKLMKVACLMLTYDRLIQKQIPSITLFRNAVENFAQQTYEAKTLLIVNSGSQGFFDECTKVIGEVEQKYPNIEIEMERVTREQCVSIADLRNHSLKMAEKSGAYLIMTWDDDDFRSTTLIEKEVKAMNDNKADMVFIKNIGVRLDISKPIFPCDYGRSFEPSMLAKLPKQVKYYGVHSDTKFVDDLENVEGYKKFVIEDNPCGDYTYCYWYTNISSREQFANIIYLSNKRASMK